MKGWIIKLVCPGNANSVAHDRLLLLKNATVNRGLGFDAVCDEKEVVIAYSERQHFADDYWRGSKYNVWEKEFGVDQTTGQMWHVKDRYEQAHPSKGFLHPVSHEWEIQETFFNLYNITPKWINCCENCPELPQTKYGAEDNHNDTLARQRQEAEGRGIEDKETGQWSGAVGMLQRDEADYALPDFALTYRKSKVAAFSPAYRFTPLYWIFKEPVYWYYAER